MQIVALHSQIVASHSNIVASHPQNAALHPQNTASHPQNAGSLSNSHFIGSHRSAVSDQLDNQITAQIITELDRVECSLQSGATCDIQCSAVTLTPVVLQSAAVVGVEVGGLLRQVRYCQVFGSVVNWLQTEYSPPLRASHRSRAAQ